MAANTTYDVKVRYILEDKASNRVASINSRLGSMGRTVSGILPGFRALSGLFLGGFAIRQAAKLLISYNAELEQTRLSMAGLIDLNLGTGFAKGLEMSSTLMKQFKDDAVVSTATFKEFADFAQMIVGPMARSGSSMQELREVTKGAVVASKALNIRPEQAALDIQQALLGTLTKRDRFARQVLEPFFKDMGVGGDFLRTWNQIALDNPAKAKKLLNDAFKQPAMLRLMKAQENSFEGLRSTIVDITQQLFGAAGAPVMAELKEVMAQVKYVLIDKKDEWFAAAKEFGNELVFAANELRSSFEFITHKSTFSELKNVFKFIAWSMNQVVDGYLLLSNALDRHLFGKGKNMVDQSGLTPLQRKYYQGLSSSTKNTVTEAQAAAMQPDLLRAGFITSTGKINFRSIANAFDLQHAADPDTYRRFAQAKDITTAKMLIEQTDMLDVKTINKFITQLEKVSAFEQKKYNAEIAQGQTEAGKIKNQMQGKLTGKGDINVTIQRIDVASEDPDRFAFGLANAFDKIAQNPNQAFSAIGEA